MVETLLGEGLVQLLGALEEEVGIAAGEEVKLHAGLLEGRDLLGGSLSGCGERADVVEHLRIEDGSGDGVAATHRQAGDGAGGRLRDRAEILLDEGNDLLAEAADIDVLEFRGAPVHLLLGDTQGAGGLLAGIAVRHHHDHRLGKALLDEVVEDLGGAAHRDPGFLVAAGAVQEVQDGVLLLGIGLIAVRGVDGQAAAVAQQLAVVPGMAHRAVLRGFAIVLGALARDDQHRQVTGTVALHIDVLRVIDGHAVHHEIVGVDLRSRKGDLDGPDVVLAADHVDGAAVRVGHPGSAELDDGGVVGLEPEGHAVALDLRRDDGSLATEREIVELLRHGGQGQRSSCCDHKQSFHTI